MVHPVSPFHVDGGHSLEFGHDEAVRVCVVSQARLQDRPLGEPGPCLRVCSPSRVEGHGSPGSASVHARAQQGERELGGDQRHERGAFVPADAFRDQRAEGVEQFPATDSRE